MPRPLSRCVASMRMRKVKWAVEYLEQSQKKAAHPEENLGAWRSGNTKLHVELGCGKGNYSLEMAKLYPDDLFIAVEKNESAAGIAAKKFDESECENLILIHGDAADLNLWFAEQEIDVLHLNFSDPWPKKRYAKRRLSSAGFLEVYQSLLSKNGEIQMKTDNGPLFEFSVIEFLNAGFILSEFYVDYRRDPHPEDAVTEYEEKFIRLGQPIYRCVFKRGDGAK